MKILIAFGFLALGLPLPVHFRYRRYALHRFKRPACTFSFKFHDPFNLFRDESNYEMARLAVIDGIEKWRRGSGGRLEFVDLSSFYSNKSVISLHDPIPDILISFALAEHSCQETFDGAGGIVAHSTYPPHGLIHLDAAENWNVDGAGGGPELSYVVSHEIGHVLGLRHSPHADSIMNPHFRGHFLGRTELGEDDIIKALEVYAHCNPSQSRSNGQFI